MLTPGHLPFVFTFLILIMTLTLIVTLILILMRTLSAIRRPNPILSADKEGELDVLGAARDQFCALKFSAVLLLTVSCSKLFQSLVHGSRPISVSAGCAQ